MENLDEEQALAQICTRLMERFPGLPGTAVRRIIDEEHRKLDGRPVRTYVPVLVERAAGAVLRGAALVGTGNVVAAR